VRIVMTLTLELRKATSTVIVAVITGYSSEFIGVINAMGVV
jgi:hypothetical protein